MKIRMNIASGLLMGALIGVIPIMVALNESTTACAPKDCKTELDSLLKGRDSVCPRSCLASIRYDLMEMRVR
jgi:hypothetical protein